MRRKLAYSNPMLVNSYKNIGSLPQGDWHVSKTGGKLFVGDSNWKTYAYLDETTDEREFHLADPTSLRLQAQDGTTCRDIAIESKPAYDIFVGGASGLLHGRHDAIQLTQAGRVMPDDGHEYRQQSDRHNHSESRHLDGDNQHPEQARHEILRQRLSARQWRLHHRVLQRDQTNQLRSTCQLLYNSLKRIPARHVVQRRVWQSDRHRDGYAHLHAGRVSGDQDPARQHRIFQRGYGNLLALSLGVAA